MPRSSIWDIPYITKTCVPMGKFYRSLFFVTTNDSLVSRDFRETEELINAIELSSLPSLREIYKQHICPECNSYMHRVALAYMIPRVLHSYNIYMYLFIAFSAIKIAMAFISLYRYSWIYYEVE